jgi:hypothetical protein
LEKCFNLTLIKIDGSSGSYNIRLLSLERAERCQNRVLVLELTDEGAANHERRPKILSFTLRVSRGKSSHSCKLIRLCTDDGADINANGVLERETAVHLGAGNGNFGKFKFLLNSGYIDTPNELGRTTKIITLADG